MYAKCFTSSVKSNDKTNMYVFAFSLLKKSQLGINLFCPIVKTTDVCLSKGPMVIILNECKFNPYKPGVLFIGQRQTE